MKKIFMTLAAVCFAATMNAQVYVGGSLGFNAWSSQENAGDRSETTFKIMPEIGYNINDSWAIGTVIGYESNKWTGVQGVSESAFSIAHLLSVARLTSLLMVVSTSLLQRMLIGMSSL